MSYSLIDIQALIANELDQSATAPTQGGTDWNIRLGAINRAQNDWAESNEWDALKVVFNGLISTATGNASLALPANFRKIDSYPLIGSYSYNVVDPSKNALYTDSDKFVNILGNDRDDNVMYIHSSLDSGASVQFTYWSSPQSLASASNLSACPDPTFLVQRALYYLYKGREDGRFPEAKVESDRILARMIENENSRGLADNRRGISNWLDEGGFRIGRD